MTKAGTIGNRVNVGILPRALVATLMTPTATLTRRNINKVKRKMTQVIAVAMYAKILSVS